MKKSSKIIILCLVLFYVVFLSFKTSYAEIIEQKDGNITNYINTEDRLYQVGMYKGASQKIQEMLIDSAFEHPEKYEPIYLVAFSDVYMKTNKDKAALYYMIGYIRSIEDVQMCKDKSAAAQVSFYPYLAQETVKYLSKMSKTKYKKLKQEAVEWDKSHPQRVHPKWACFHGLAAFESNDVNTLPLKQYTKIQDETRENFLK